MTHRYESPSNDPAVAAQEALNEAGYRGEPVTLAFRGGMEWDDAPVSLEVKVTPGETKEQVVAALKKASGKRQ